MSDPVSAVPEGYTRVTPYLTIDKAAEAIEFYKKVFSAEEVSRMDGPQGYSVMHAELKIGDAHIMISGEWPNSATVSPATAGAATASIMLFVDDCDDSFRRAVDAGAKPVSKPMDTFWGHRHALVRDPFGHCWQLSTRIKDMTQEEIEAAGKEWMKQMETD